MGVVLLVDVNQHRGQCLSSGSVVDKAGVETAHADRVNQIDNNLAGGCFVARHEHIAGTLHVGLEVRRGDILSGSATIR